MKKLLMVLCFVLALTVLVGCNNETPDDKETTLDTDTVTESDTESDESVESTDITETLGGTIMLTDEFDFTPKSQNSKLNTLDYVKVSEIASEYVTKTDEFTYIDYTAPQFDLGGIAYPSENGGMINRLDGNNYQKFEDNLVSRTATSRFAHHTAGVTLRFATNAKEINLKSTVTKTYSSNVVEKRGTVGFDVYVGTGTSRTYNQAMVQMLINVAEGDTIKLPGGYCEVIIHLPQMASIRTLQIGFSNDNALVAEPLERDIAPIVFYGSGITQGMASSRAGITYTNTVCRMLNADCINLGFYEGAHGEQVMAEYIAGIEKMSAFVMEYDYDSPIDELRANHYNFYKTVRNAHPDIPVVIMSSPIMPMFAPEEAAERAAIIKETCDKAIAEGDKNIYFLDGANVFPMTGKAVELYTGDSETLSDTGMQYLAACVYDILKSAFTDDAEKSGTDRLPGLRDPIAFEAVTKNGEIDESRAVAVSDIDKKYIDSESKGITYLDISTPQFEMGGIKKPEDNGGMFYRVDYARKDEFVSNMLSPKDYPKLFQDMAGVSVRFVTNADEIVIKAKLNRDNISASNNSPRGISGFDVYVGSGTDRVYCGAVGQDMTDVSLNETVKLPGGFVEVMIEFPSYTGVTSFAVGFSDKNAKICEPTERTHKQIVYYGSSITQGCSAARSGLVYTNIVSRLLDADCKNLGFAASARGEQIMAEYIASLDMAAFVLDYDYNSVYDELVANHYNFYKTVRDANPDIPIVLMSRPVFKKSASDAEIARIKTIEDTYKKAVAAGDKNIYMIRGDSIFPFKSMADFYTIDFCHPNDAGFYYMAKACYEVLDEALNK